MREDERGRKERGKKAKKEEREKEKMFALRYIKKGTK